MGFRQGRRGFGQPVVTAFFGGGGRASDYPGRIAQRVEPIVAGGSVVPTVDGKPFRVRR